MEHEDNKLRHWELAIDKAERTQDVKGTGAMMANHCHVCLHDSTREMAWCHHQCQCFVKRVFVQHHAETHFPQTFTIPGCHFDHLELIKEKAKQSDKKVFFCPYWNRKISEEQKSGDRAPWIQALSSSSTLLLEGRLTSSAPGMTMSAHSLQVS